MVQFDEKMRMFFSFIYALNYLFIFPCFSSNLLVISCVCMNSMCTLIALFCIVSQPEFCLVDKSDNIFLIAKCRK